MQNADLMAACPAAFYRPNRPCPEELLVQHGGTPGVSKSRGDAPFFFATEEIRVATGGNRSAKTTKIIIEMGSTLTGFRPWVKASSPWYTKGLVASGTSKRVRVFLIIANYKTKIPDIMEELEKWWPRKFFWRVTAKDKDGPREIEWFNGNVVRLFSHKLATEDLEGTEAELMVFDEPPPEKTWNALTRGLLSTNGKVIVGATLLDRSEWFWDQIVHPGETGEDDEIKVTWHSIWDNCAENGGCPTQLAAKTGRYLKRFRDPDERLAREHGHPMHVGGLVLSCFSKDNVIDPFELPAETVVYSCIDPSGGGKPMAGVWVAVLRWLDPVELHIFDESYDRRSAGHLGFFAEDFLARENGMSFVAHPGPSSMILIDPAANQKMMGDGLGRSMRVVLFEDYGISTVEANKSNKRARLLSLNGKCNDGQVKVWSNCREARKEAYKWKYDDTSSKMTSGPDDIWDGVSYIESFDPVRVATAIADDEETDVWVPEQYRRREQREKRFRKKYKEDWRRRKMKRARMFQGFREDPDRYLQPEE
ncbi:MAG: hypothetical protein ACE5FA_00380 [Dehalococcoidia bacterium]